MEGVIDRYIASALDHGLTPDDILASTPGISSDPTVRLYTASVALGHGAEDLNRTLLQAAMTGDLVIASLMLYEGATNLNPSLAVSAQFNHADMVSFLIESGADNLNEVLVEVCRNVNIAKVLIIHGADMSLCDFNFTSADLAELYAAGVKQFGRYDRVMLQYHKLRQDELARVYPRDLSALIVDY